ncbi:hypothetical protein NEOLI_004772 [Neolecta irregularis DAH-3]|uniref:Cyclin-domain-containing protein n=1 Tax=Neolecta irregularis (strain DAH-3) TaxID=1198029 RepID=A0A1U7LQI0_NEOID|nr:hypothetical protein NEOLI_004772 [Neolecta irregularis DAH-3]|eukprot:OLL24930.1 hypothetical protein NEOLI_004772 [Neolecta irregularis DAH-3]
MRYSLPLFGLLFGSTILGAPTSVPNDCSASTCSKAQPESVENNAVITGSGFISQKTNMGIIGEEGDEFGDSFGGGELDNNDVIVSQGSTNGVAGGCKPGGTTECPTASASEVGKGSKVVTSPKPVIPKGQSEANTIKGTPVATGQVGNVKSAAPAASRIGLESVPPTTVKPASSAASPIGVKSAPPAASPVGVKSAPPAASPIGVKSVPQATSLTTVKPASPAPSSTGAKPAPLAASSNNVKSASPAASLTGAKPVSQAATSTQNAKPPLQTSGARTTSSVAPPTPAQVHLTSDLQQKKLAVPVTISPCENGCFPPQEILTMPSHYLERLVRASPSGALTRFRAQAAPSISIGDYLGRIVRYAETEISPLLCTVVYVQRLRLAWSDFEVTDLTVHRFLIAATTVASKGLCDIFSTNRHYAKVGGVSIREMNHLEIELLRRLDFRVLPDFDDLQRVYADLVLGFAEMFAFEAAAGTDAELKEEACKITEILDPYPSP